MAETHLWMVVAPFVVAMWWTKHWLMDSIIARWRFGAASLSGAILWVYLAYAATYSVDPSGGTTFEAGSVALAYFSGFMAFVSVAGFFLGLMLWVEEEGERSAAELPAAIRAGMDD